MYKTTATSPKRKREKERIEYELGLPEFGKDVKAIFITLAGYEVAHGYERFVHGGRGSYLEFNQEQVIWHNFADKGISRLKYFRKWFSPDGVMLYDQLKKVRYADYKIGMIYASPQDIIAKK
jgi:hypothetical protein